MTRIVNVHIITRLELGGAQQNTLYTVTHLDPRKFLSYLVTGRGGLLDGEASSLLGTRLIFCGPLVRKINPFQDLRALFDLVRILRTIRTANSGLPMVVHTHSSKAGILGRFAAKLAGLDQIVHTYHGFAFHEFQNPWVRQLYIFFEKALGRITKKQVFVSRDNERAAGDLGLICHDSRIIRSGISFKSFRESPGDRDKIRKEFGLSDSVPAVMTIACFKPQKAPLDFVAMADAVRSQFPDVRFYMAGDGELRSPVETEIARRGLKDHIILLGWRRDIQDLLAGSDIFVLSSRWEGLPRVLIEARLAGLPAVTTDIEGASEIVSEGQTGFIVPRKDYLALAEKVLYLLRHPAEARKMGDAARSVPLEFDIDEMVRSQEKLYESMVDGV